MIRVWLGGGRLKVLFQQLCSSLSLNAPNSYNVIH